jgi:hypothetical protein
MSREFDDIINTLLSQIWDIEEVDARHLCELYLRSSCQKHLFAETRVRSLRRKVAYHKRGRKVVHREGHYEVNYPQNVLSIEMDFDHCILSLRSSLEHLAQLVNAIVPLNLPPKGKASESVNLRRVIDTIAENHQWENIPYLNELSSKLKRVLGSNWYKELHDLRIESFHVKSGRLPKTALMTQSRDLIKLTFLLPDGTVNSLKTEKDRDILNYCRNRVKDVEKTLNTSFHLLSDYMSYRMD